MPSLPLNLQDSFSPKEKKMKDKKPNLNVEDETMTSSTTEKKKSSSKKSKKIASTEEDHIMVVEDGEVSVKLKKDKKKKRKVVAEDSDESELVDVEPVFAKKAKLKKASDDDDDNDEKKVVEKVEVPVVKEHALEKFRISKPLKDKLLSKGIDALFPIQAMTFDKILNGADLLGRARTGQGKTLAFVLPLLESLVNGPAKGSRKTGYGRAPSVLVLLPTRELAKQVFADFELYGGSVGLTGCCLYGGAGGYRSQEMSLKRGVDIVIGTPGRIKDHIERGNIDFSSLKFRVLDEADEMLKMGFVDDVELILGKVKDVTQVQTLLFSATTPPWINNIARKFLKSDKVTVDLVGNEKMKASNSVRHIVLPCSSAARAQLIPDIIRCYSGNGRTIIFTETKDQASQLTGVLPDSRALHGDIQQSTREVTLAGFRSGKFLTLVATNVAARGLDINDVQLVIQCEPPKDVEDYIHRSGRTGRAGNTGVAVMLYDPNRSNFSRIERESGVKFEKLLAPQPSDVAKAVGIDAAEMITKVSDSVIPIFKSTAQELLDSSGLSAVNLLAKALAKAAGYTEIKSRSLLSSAENHTTLLLESVKPIYSSSFVINLLARFVPKDKVDSVKDIALTADNLGAVFDVATADLDAFLEGQKNAAEVSIEVLKELPKLKEREQRSSWGGGSRFGGRGGGGFSRGRGGNRFGGGKKW